MMVRYANRAVVVMGALLLMLVVAYYADETGYRRGACSAIHAYNDDIPSCIGIGDDGFKTPQGDAN